MLENLGFGIAILGLFSEVLGIGLGMSDLIPLEVGDILVWYGFYAALIGSAVLLSAALSATKRSKKEVKEKEDNKNI